MYALARITLPRGAAVGVALALATGAGLIVRFASSGSVAPAVAWGLSAALGTTFVACAERDERERARAPALIALAVMAIACVASPALRTSLAGFASLAILALTLIPLALSAISLRGRTTADRLAGVAITAALVGYVVWRFAASRPLLFSDFMICRLFSTDVAQLVRDGAAFTLPAAVVQSISTEYSLLPALLPGVALAATDPLSPWVYEASIAALYGAPAILALAFWARRLAFSAGAAPRRLSLFIAALAVCVAAPGLASLIAMGMPDIGGVALTVLALELARRLALRLSEQNAGAPIALAVQLVATLFLMFLFRRWYLFASAGVATALSLELAALAFAGRLRRRELLTAGAAAGLVGLALSAPVAIVWLNDLQSHDYALIYAGYNYGLSTLLTYFGDLYGVAILALAGCACATLFAIRLDNAPLRLTLVASLTAAALQLRVQSPALHHMYLILPLLTAPVAAVALLAPRPAAFAGLAVLASLTLSPAAALVAPAHWLPRILPAPSPRPDLTELLRIRSWIDAVAAPDRRYCALGSNSTFSGVLLDALWQLPPARSPDSDPARRASIVLPQVDARDGPIGAEFKGCEFLLVASPTEPHLPRDFMWDVALPSAEALSGEGIGAYYKRTGEVFHLQNGVDVVVMRRAAPVGDEAIAALRERWRAAPRSDAARRAASRFLD